MKKLFVLVVFILMVVPFWASAIPPTPPIFVTEGDGGPAGTASKFVFTNGTVTLSAGVATIDITGGAGQPITLDLGDDGGDDSVNLGEIAVTGDTNSIFTESSADKLLIAVGNNWPTADVANAGDSATAFFSAGTIEDDYLPVPSATSGGIAPTTSGASDGHVLTVQADGSAAWEAAGGGIATIEAATDTAISTPAEADILIYDGSNSWDNKAVSGDVTIAATGAVTIGNDKVLEAHLKAVDAAADENILTYESTTGDFEWHTAAEVLANISATQGTILYRSDTAWVALDPGVSGQYLQTQGAAANPQWASTAISGDIETVGDVTSGAAFTADGAGNTLYFEGSTPNAYEIILTGADPGADVTITLPAETGTVLLTDGTNTDNAVLRSDGTGSLAQTSGVVIDDSDNVTGVVALTMTGALTAGSGAHVLTSAAGLIDGEKIQDGTIDDDALDFTDITGADLTLTDCTTITASGTITGEQLTSTDDATITDVLSVGGSVVPDEANGATVGTAALEWADLYLHDGAVIYFGADQDVTLTHVADTALALNLDLRIADNQGLVLGSNQDYDLYYDETTADGIVLETAAVGAASAATPMINFRVNSGSGTLTDGQRVFQVTNDTTALMYVDENGDMTIAGSVYTAASTDPGVVLDETTAGDTDYWFGINADQEGDDDDYFAIGTGTTVGTGSIYTINPSGDVVASGTQKGTAFIMEGGTYDTTLGPGTPTASVSYTWPAAAPVSNGYVLSATTAGTLSWAEMTATAGGADTQVQYNASGSLGAEAAFAYNATNNTLSLTQAASNPTLQVGDGTYSWNHTPQVGIEGVLEVDSNTFLNGGVVFGSDGTVTTAGEVGYASGAFTFFGANSENAVLTVGSASNVNTFSSGTSATYAFTPAVALNGGLTVGTSSIPMVVGTGTASGITAAGQMYFESDTEILTIGDGATSIGLDMAPNVVYTFPAATSTLATLGANTFTGTQALGANNLTMTGSLAATGDRVTKGWFTDVESTNIPTVGGTALLSSITAPVFSTSIEAPFIILGSAATAADAGTIRMPNAGSIQFEADAAGTDVNALSVDASEVVQIAASGASGVTITPDTTITGDLTVSGADINVAAAGVKLTGSNGSLTILGLGDGQDEDIKIDLNTTANTITVSSPASSAAEINFSALHLVTTGAILGAININSDINGMSQGEMTTARVYGTMFFATGAGTWNLPAAAAGMSLCVYSTTAAAVVINPDDGDTIVLNGTALSAGDSITSASAAGDFITLVALDANTWYTLGRSGTWTDTN